MEEKFSDMLACMWNDVFPLSINIHEKVVNIKTPTKNIQLRPTNLVCFIKVWLTR